MFKKYNHLKIVLQKDMLGLYTEKCNIEVKYKIPQ